MIFSYQVFFCALGSNLKWSAVLQPFSPDTWLAVCTWVMLGTLTISFCHYCISASNEENEFTPTVSFFFILQSLCQQGKEKNFFPRFFCCVSYSPRGTMPRIFYFSLNNLSCVLIVFIYCT